MVSAILLGRVRDRRRLEVKWEFRISNFEFRNSLPVSFDQEPGMGMRMGNSQFEIPNSKFPIPIP